MSKMKGKPWGLIVCIGISLISSIGLYHSVSVAHNLIGAAQSLEAASGTMNWSMEGASAAEAIATMLYNIFTWLAVMVVIWGTYVGVRLIRANRPLGRLTDRVTGNVTSDR